MEFIISFDSPRLGYGHVILDNSSRSGICRGVTAVLGRNGSGKSTLGNIIANGRYAFGNRLGFAEGISSVRMLSFTDIHSLTGIDVQYFSQRMEATANEYVPSVSDIFHGKFDSPLWKKYSCVFRLHDIAEKKINYLSSGELRKLLIINALCDNPDLLIFDNPYIGLDARARADFDEAIGALREQDVSVVFLLCDPAEVPDYVDSIIEMSDCSIGFPITGTSEINSFLRQSAENEVAEIPPLPDLSVPRPHENCDIVFSIKDGHARYADKVIFENFNWTVRRGECWSLTGPNGSGKSLLLSMVSADNPQAYANDITIFDRRRGSGESIWEIKDAIGYVCPEMQLYFKSSKPVREIIIEGMRNALDRYRKSTPDEQAVADDWMNVLEIGHLSDRKFSELSSGEQRIVMIARALAKQPELLVLDEPLHGLDQYNKDRIKSIISRLIETNRSTLIYVSHYTEEFPDCITYTKQMPRKS